MSKINKKYKAPFTQIPNLIFELLARHHTAFILYCYFLKVPDNWDFLQWKMQEEFDISIHTFNKAIVILENLGLVKRERIRKDGKLLHYDYDIYFPDERALGEKNEGRNFLGDKSSPHTNKESLQKKNSNKTNSKELVANQTSHDVDIANSIKNSNSSVIRENLTTPKSKKNSPDLEAIKQLLINFKINESLEELDLIKNQILYLHWITHEMASNLKQEGVLYNLTMQLPLSNKQLNGESIKRQQLKKYILWIIGDGKNGVIQRKGTITHFRSSLNDWFINDYGKVEKEYLKTQKEGYSSAHNSKPYNQPNLPTMPPRPKDWRTLRKEELEQKLKQTNLTENDKIRILEELKNLKKFGNINPKEVQ